MKNKKIIVLVLGVILILLSIFIIKNTNRNSNHLDLKFDYKNIEYQYQESFKKKNGYRNVIILLNKTNNEVILPNIKLKFLTKRNKVIEEIIIKPEIIKAKGKIKIEFNSKKNLSNSASLNVSYDSLFDVSKSYQDANVKINDFMETNSEYLFNIKNISQSEITTKNFVIEYLDEKYDVILETSYNLMMKKDQLSTITIKKTKVNSHKIKYIRIKSY